MLLGQHFQDLGHSFSPYGPPSRQITYIYQLYPKKAALSAALAKSSPLDFPF